MNTIITDSICLPFDLTPRAARCLQRWLNLRIRSGSSLPHLVFVGRIFQHNPEQPNGRERLLQFLEANLGLLTALRSWGGAGGALTVIVEDDPVLDQREAWALLCELLPVLNEYVSRPLSPLADGAPA